MHQDDGLVSAVREERGSLDRLRGWTLGLRYFTDPVLKVVRVRGHVDVDLKMIESLSTSDHVLV